VANVVVVSLSWSKAIRSLITSSETVIGLTFSSVCPRAGRKRRSLFLGSWTALRGSFFSSCWAVSTLELSNLASLSSKAWKSWSPVFCPWWALISAKLPENLSSLGLEWHPITHRRLLANILESKWDAMSLFWLSSFLGSSKSSTGSCPFGSQNRILGNAALTKVALVGIFAVPFPPFSPEVSQTSKRWPSISPVNLFLPLTTWKDPISALSLE